MKALGFATVLAAIFLAAAPLSTYAADTSGGAKDMPPVSQTLVREGDYAVNLAKALDLGNTDEEGEAEVLLASAGIAPKGGWISDFPVTPDIIGDLQMQVINAADAGKVKMDARSAEKAFLTMNKRLGLPITASQLDREKEYSGAQEGEDYEYREEPAVVENTYVENYYYEEGPPVVTYYQPPLDYFYLYSWCSYPFWYSGFHFPGYWVLNDFTTIVVVNNDGGTVVVRGGKVIVKGGTVVLADGTVVTGKTKVVSNTKKDPVTKKTVSVDPVTKQVRTASNKAVEGGAASRSGLKAGAAARAGDKAGGFDKRSAGNILKKSVERDATKGMSRDAVSVDRAARAGGKTLGGGADAGAANLGRRSGDNNPAQSLKGRSSSIGRDGGRDIRTSPAYRDRSFGTLGRGENPAPSLKGRSYDSPSRSAGSIDSAPSMRGGSYSGDSGRPARSFDPAPSMRGRSFDSGMARGGDHGARGASPQAGMSRGGDGGRSFGGGGRSFSAPSAPSIGSRGGGGGGGFGKTLGGGGGGGGCRGKC